MPCLTVTVTPLQPCAVKASPAAPASLAVAPSGRISVSVSAAAPLQLSLSAAGATILALTPWKQASLAVGEVCSVPSGTIVVLAAADGPLLTKSGGYLLLNPATNPPE